MRRAHFLARRRERNAAAQRDPLGAALERPLLPREPIVELAHEHEHSVRIGIHLAHEAADRSIELVNGAPIGGHAEISGRIGHHGTHGGPPCECYWYTDSMYSSPIDLQ